MAARLFFALLFVATLSMSQASFAQDAAKPEDPDPTPPASPSTPSPVPNVQMTIELIEGSKILGSPIELTALPMKVDFGEIEVALTLIQQLTFTKDRASVVVKFRNGDQVTGALQLKQIKIKTAFGQATIPIERIAKLSIAPK